MATTPGIVLAADESIASIRAWGIGERTNAM
jgi:hypothetical protein